MLTNPVPENNLLGEFINPKHWEQLVLNWA